MRYEAYLHRNPDFRAMSTGLDPQADVLDLLHAIVSRGLVEDLLRERHGHQQATVVRPAAADIVSPCTPTPTYPSGRLGCAAYLAARDSEDNYNGVHR